MRLDVKAAWGLALAWTLGTAAAQFPPDHPDWKEIEAPVPAALRLDRLIPLEVPRSTLQFSVDASSVAIGDDSIVRYVLVARGEGGVVNAAYEGIRCSSTEVKVYARHDPTRGWVPARDPQWVLLQSGAHARTSLLVARSGACMGHAPNGSAQRIVRDLQLPAAQRFAN